MIQRLIKLANRLDTAGKVNKADRVDSYILKCAEDDKEPTLEELMQLETQLDEEGIDQLTNEDVLEGLEGDDRMVAEQYLGGEEPGAHSGVSHRSVPELLSDLKNQQSMDVARERSQEEIMEQLSQVLMQGMQTEQADPMRMDRGHGGFMPEAELMSDLAKLADMLDAQKMHKEADFFTNMMEKIAEDGPDDFFDSMGDFEEEEPSTEELVEMEGEEDDQFYTMLGFVERIAKGMYMDMGAAQMAAKSLIEGFDTSHAVPVYEHEELSPEQPDNLLEFPGQ